MGKRKINHKRDEYAALRNTGLTYKQIAEIYGCSYQNIAQQLSESKTSQFRGFSKEQCVYDGLRNWLNENKCSLSELLRRIYGMNPPQATHTRYSKCLKGKLRLVMSEINAIIDITGLTYEELFR